MEKEDCKKKRLEKRGLLEKVSKRKKKEDWKKKGLKRWKKEDIYINDIYIYYIYKQKDEEKEPHHSMKHLFIN